MNEHSYLTLSRLSGSLRNMHSRGLHAHVRARYLVPPTSTMLNQSTSSAFHKLNSFGCISARQRTNRPRAWLHQLAPLCPQQTCSRCVGGARPVRSRDPASPYIHMTVSTGAGTHLHRGKFRRQAKRSLLHHRTKHGNKLCRYTVLRLQPSDSCAFVRLELSANLTA